MRQRLRQVSEHVGGVVRGHLLDRLLELLAVEELGEIVTQVVGKLLHQIGDSGDRQALEDPGPVLAAENVDEQGEVGRVQEKQECVERFEVTALDQVHEIVDLGGRLDVGAGDPIARTTLPARVVIHRLRLLLPPGRNTGPRSSYRVFLFALQSP